MKKMGERAALEDEGRALSALLSPISDDAHKYTRGSLLILAGSRRFPGAAVLAAKAAARAGAGYVTLAIPEPVVTVAQAHLLSVPVIAAPADDGAFAADAWESIRDQLTHLDAIVLGPGLTITPSTSAFVQAVLSETGGVRGTRGTREAREAGGVGATDGVRGGRGTGEGEAGDVRGVREAGAGEARGTREAREAGGVRGVSEARGTREACEARAGACEAGGVGDVRGTGEGALPVLLDADALNILSVLMRQGFNLKTLDKALILTPHARELERLCEATEVPDAPCLAKALQAIIVAKGPETRIVSPTREYHSTSGTSALAKAGTGDVLAGVIGSFIAQGVVPFEAATLGVEIHNRAGQFAENTLGRRAVCAEDVLEAIPAALRSVEA
jgi:NAD(P)H-hydrate repair Nnr-like enzyme with NAD(P)H-hydrate dehydratase domain